DFEEENLRRGLKALGALGYRPRAPVAIEDFADAGKRASWIREKDLKVFSLSSPAQPATEIDLFVEPPFDFAAAYARAQRFDVAAGLPASFVSFDDLIILKRRAGRPRDLDDIEHLRRIRADQESG
ncbi:MAG: hypothetical protein HY553_15130, partial [Elusimicrobia bacterium]|nr:hypothetical protein [Elusimicrobiota bacterium]